MTSETDIVHGARFPANRHAPSMASLESCALDIWVRQGLAARHDAVLAESLPAEWLDLIQQSI